MGAVRGPVEFDGRRLIACGSSEMGDLIAIELVDPDTIIEDVEGNVVWIDGWVAVVDRSSVRLAA